MYYEYSNNCIPYAGYGLSFHTTVVAELEFNTENLSLLQGQQTESTKHYGPLPNGLACRLRNKEDEVHSSSKRNTKHQQKGKNRCRTVHHVGYHACCRRLCRISYSRFPTSDATSYTCKFLNTLSICLQHYITFVVIQMMSKHGNNEITRF